MTETGWEERMALRARERHFAIAVEQYVEGEADFASVRCTVPEYLDRMGMTEAEAMRHVMDGPQLCACSGPPVEVSREPDPPCRCALLWLRIEQLLGPVP